MNAIFIAGRQWKYLYQELNIIEYLCTLIRSQKSLFMLRQIPYICSTVCSTFSGMFCCMLFYLHIFFAVQLLCNLHILNFGIVLLGLVFILSPLTMFVGVAPLCGIDSDVSQLSPTQPVVCGNYLPYVQPYVCGNCGLFSTQLQLHRPTQLYVGLYKFIVKVKSWKHVVKSGCLMLQKAVMPL